MKLAAYLTGIVGAASSIQQWIFLPNQEQSQRLVTRQLERYDPFIALQLNLSMVEKMSTCKAPYTSEYLFHPGTYGDVWASTLGDVRKVRN